ncbi:hypothetical protein [Methylosinus sp. KRF6]|uniref:hypothetical protein n=1 Tax=Methylosinus sp. KRF6 TaxID=2846853 RepID=UPI001C0CE96B|nr:hypothetical protein [Methylosinus sp. KRF6]MBU3887216.1 hypothetical protein [Methylosinus sp. KRF6]
MKQQISFTVADFGQFSIRFPDGRVMFGDEFLSLISELYGIPRGVAAVRILEATTNARFDATAALEIAAAVDRWVDRGAPKNEERRT